MNIMDDITLTINGKDYKYSVGNSLYEISRDFQNQYRFPIIIARVDNKLSELSMLIEKPCTIEFLDLTTREGNRCHVNGLVFMLLYTVKRLFGQKSDIFVQHSLDSGVYIETNFKLTEEKVKAIKAEMKKVIEQQTPIRKSTVDRLEAIKYFESVGYTSKSDVLKYNADNYITLYRLGNLYDYFYDVMPCSTGYIKDFDITYLDNKSLVLRYPTVYINDKIKPYKHHPHLFETITEYHEWAKLMKLEYSGDLNRVVSEGKIRDLIKIDDILSNGRLLQTAKTISDNKKKLKIVLIAGPSSSGKTTTSKKLCMYLESFGLHPKVLSMDDYFVEIKDNPKNEDGSYDFECLEAVDLKLFDKQVEKLLKGEEIEKPTYNFALGKKEYHDKMMLEENEILVIEGIHALDTKVLDNIPREKKYKIYISPITELCLDAHNRISTTDNRLLRRIVRDARTRNNNIESTLEQWPKVREGEEKYIFPFQDQIDKVINSAAIYEMGVLKTYVEPLLYTVTKDSPQYEEARRLIKILRLFLPIASDAIPEDAVFREFIGKSYFE